MACMSVYCWYHNPLCELRHVQWELQSLSMHACVMQLHVPIKLKKLNVYTLQTWIPFKLSIPKVLVFMTTCIHSFLREGLVNCLFALSWMIRKALVIHSYISDFKKTRVSFFFNCNEQHINNWTSLLQIDHTVFHHIFSLQPLFGISSLNDLLALPKLHYFIIVLSSIFLAIWLKVFMIEPWLESL